MAAEGKAEHTYYAELDNWLAVDSVSITMIAIGRHDPNAREFFFWKNVSFGEAFWKQPRLHAAGLPTDEPPTWKVTGRISKVVFDATQHTGTYESRLSTWEDAVTAAKSVVRSAYHKEFEEVQQKEIELPLLTFDLTKKLRGLFFELMYTQADVLAGRVPLALNENINVDSISEAFSGFQLKLRTNRNKDVKEFLKRRETAVGQDSSVTGSSATGSPQCAAGSPATGSPQHAAGSSATGSPMKRVATALASGSPFKRFASALAKSPIGHVVSPSATSGSAQRSAPEVFLVYGLVSILQDKDKQ